MKLAIHEPKVLSDGGPWAIHDFACPVCSKNQAVLQLNYWIFTPCWECKKKGFQIVKLPKNKLLKWLFKNYCV